jgi:hypothetical protein
MLAPEDAKKLRSNPEWQRLEEHITECIDALDSCTTIPDGEEHSSHAMARKEAVNTLHKILEPFAYDPKPNHDKRIESMRKLGLTD